MIQFDIQKFLEGQPVITAGGLKVRRLREINYQGSHFKFLTALVNNIPAIWDYSGNYMNGDDPSMNLLMDTPIVFNWVLNKDLVSIEPTENKGRYTKVIIP